MLKPNDVLLKQYYSCTPGASQRLLQQSCTEALHDEMHAQKYCCMEDNSLHKPEHRKQTKGANIYNNNGTHIEPGNLGHKA